MAFLDKFALLMEQTVFKYMENITTLTKSPVVHYRNQMSKQIETLDLYCCKKERTLKYAFSADAPDLPNENRYDLRRICAEGTSRMVSYIRQYILTPPKDIPQKRFRHKLKSFYI